MRQDLIVSQSIVVNASVAKVWDAMTNPDIIKEYLFGTETVTDWKVGNEVVFQGEYDGHKYRDKGVVQENITNELLSYSYWSGFSGLEDKPENYSTVTYGLKSIDNNTTELTWTQKGYATEQVYEHSQSGMQEFIEGIKKIIER